MNPPEDTTHSLRDHDLTAHTLPTRLARRRLLAGRLAASVFAFNVLFALIGGWLLSGPAAWVSRIRLGMWSWAGALFLVSALLSVPVVGAAIYKVLHPPPEEPASPD